MCKIFFSAFFKPIKIQIYIKSEFVKKLVSKFNLIMMIKLYYFYETMLFKRKEFNGMDRVLKLFNNTLEDVALNCTHMYIHTSRFVGMHLFIYFHLSSPDQGCQTVYFQNNISQFV
jgi:hypothetical protein